jgi:putative DNA primase/helicase
VHTRKLAHAIAREMLVNAFEATARTADKQKQKDALIKFCVGSGNSSRINNMLSQAEPYLAVEADDLDKDPWLLNCPNGTVDLRTGELRPHDQADLITKICGTDYDPRAKCSRWEQFLLEIFDNDNDMVAVVQRAIGYSLTGMTNEQVVFIMHGSGSNGKSVLLETIAAVLADYVKRSPADTWVSKPANGPSNDVAALAGARFVSVVETEHDKQLAEALVKTATGGDVMTARFLHKEFFSFIPKFKLWFATNHKPKIRGSDFAIWRRIILLPFAVTFNDPDKITGGQKAKDPGLKAKLAEEYPGILAWMIRGCMAWQKDGLKPPEAVIHATETYQDSQDNVSGFIRDNCWLQRSLECPVGLLYAANEIWCEENEEEALSSRAFGKNLDERGLPPGKRDQYARKRQGIDY